MFVVGETKEVVNNGTRESGGADPPLETEKQSVPTKWGAVGACRVVADVGAGGAAQAVTTERAKKMKRKTIGMLPGGARGVDKMASRPRNGTCTRPCAHDARRQRDQQHVLCPPPVQRVQIGDQNSTTFKMKAALNYSAPNCRHSHKTR